MPGEVETDRSARLSTLGIPASERRLALQQAEAASGAVQAPPEEHSYYDVSILQRPSWGWEIATYFFLGGLSAGAYLVSRTAERMGGDKYRALSRNGAEVAFLTFVPWPPPRVGWRTLARRLARPRLARPRSCHRPLLRMPRRTAGAWAGPDAWRAAGGPRSGLYWFAGGRDAAAGCSMGTG